MTKIMFKKSGGLMGREVETNLDLNQLPDDEAQELQRLILDSNLFNMPQNMIEPSRNDEYEYTISVDAGNSHHTIQTTDSSAPESLRPLLEKLSTLAKEDNSRIR